MARSANRRKKRWIPALGVAGLATVLGVACAPSLATIPDETIRTEVKATNDPYSTTVDYEGPLVSLRGCCQALLRGWRDRKTGGIAHQLYVVTGQCGWAFYQSATFEGGVQASFASINKEVGDCGQYNGCYNECFNHETFGITLSDDYLQARKLEGFAIEAQARNGTRVVISMPPNYIRGYLAAVDGR